jgi:hypothetical protein
MVVKQGGGKGRKERWRMGFGGAVFGFLFGVGVEILILFVILS